MHVGYDTKRSNIQRHTGPSAQAGAANPISLTSLAELDLVISSWPTAIRMQVESEMAAVGCRPRLALEVDVVVAVLDLVADGR
jgi:LysR family nitrogen assimilation transcriptional regulator